MTEITITPDLNCDVRYLGDSSPEWYGATACATLVSVGGVLYGPASIPAGSGATGVLGYTAFTPVSQSLTGDGSAATPYTITTVVALGSTGIQLTEVDSYVAGQESYRTDVTLVAPGGAVNAKVYRGGDCYLQDSDFGLGELHAGGSPVCRALPGSAAPDRIEGFYPLTAGSHHIVDNYDAVWTAIGTQQDLPDTVLAGTAPDGYDNGIALSWAVSVPAAGGVTLSHLTVFSPLGAAPVVFTKTADEATVSQGAQDGYTVTMSNSGALPITLNTITDTLPASFTYTAGSTTGATTADPTVVGQTLTWSGPFVVPASTGSTPGSLSLHFGVLVSAGPGTYTNTVTGAGDNVAVVPAVDTAAITVLAVNGSPTGSAGGPYAGTEGSSIAISGSASDPDPGDTVVTEWTVAPGAGVDPGASCVIASPSSLATSVTCTDDGVFDLTLTLDDGHNAPVALEATLTVGNASPQVTITSPTSNAQLMVGATVNLSADVADSGSNDTIAACTIDWGDGAVTAGVIGTASCTGSHSYAGVGVYTIRVTVTDDDGGEGTAETDVVVYDHETKVTGGGFIVDDVRMSFGFVAKGVDPDFTGQFQVRSLRDRFHGDTVSALAVLDNTATWSGTGRWNGMDGYAFEVRVVDNGSGNGRHKTPDTVQATIRDAGGNVVLSHSGALKGGNITVHQ